MVSLIQHFEADFLWKVSLKIRNSEIILKTFTHVSLATGKISIFQLVSVAEKAGLSMTWPDTLKTDVLARRPIC